MPAKVLLVLGMVVALGAASLRPTSPDQLHDLLVWAQRAQDHAKAAAAAARLHDKPDSPEKPWRGQQSERPAPSTPQPQTQRQPQTQTQPQPQTQAQPWAPPPVADSLLELSRPGLPAYEEYDRNQRFSHSFLHGYRHT